MPQRINVTGLYFYVSHGIKSMKDDSSNVYSRLSQSLNAAAAETNDLLSSVGLVAYTMRRVVERMLLLFLRRLFKIC